MARVGGRRRLGVDAPHWILVAYGLTQAVVTTLMVFEVVTTTTLASAVTAVALIAYVAANEVIVGRWRRGPTPEAHHPDPGR